MVLAVSHRISPVPWYSGISLRYFSYTYRTITFYGIAFQQLQFGSVVVLCESYNPKKSGNFLVWAVPISLATTQGITIVFSSSRYLDVSVPWVCFSFEMTSLQLAGLPHSEIYGSKSLCNYP